MGSRERDGICSGSAGYYSQPILPDDFQLSVTFYMKPAFSIFSFFCCGKSECVLKDVLHTPPDKLDFPENLCFAAPG